MSETDAIEGCPNCHRSISQEDLADHLEDAHHEPQLRAGETEEQMISRFIINHPAARECLRCNEQNRPWAISVRPSMRFSRKKEQGREE